MLVVVTFNIVDVGVVLDGSVGFTIMGMPNVGATGVLSDLKNQPQQFPNFIEAN